MTAPHFLFALDAGSAILLRRGVFVSVDASKLASIPGERTEISIEEMRVLMAAKHANAKKVHADAGRIGMAEYSEAERDRPA